MSICTGRDAAGGVCSVCERTCGGLLEPGQERGRLVAGGMAGGQQKALGQDSVDFQAARANCRLDSAQVLTGSSPGQPRTEADSVRV